MSFFLFFSFSTAVVLEDNVFKNEFTIEEISIEIAWYEEAKNSSLNLEDAFELDIEA